MIKLLPLLFNKGVLSLISIGLFVFISSDEAQSSSLLPHQHQGELRDDRFWNKKNMLLSERSSGRALVFVLVPVTDRHNVLRSARQQEDGLMSIVSSIDVQPGYAMFTFQDGLQGQLVAKTPDYAYFLKLGYQSLERKSPLAVSLDGQNHISNIARADSDFAKELLDDEPTQIKVFFYGNAGIYKLPKNHPRFAQLRETLQLAIKKRTRLWFIAQPNTLRLMDLQHAPS